ncbi:MAG TPA: MFS transporter [Acetobacteraceae bacterium]|nr:MFS transporter [Acetobacteraceae bacterium]
MYYDDSVIEQSTTQMLLQRLLPLLCLLAMAHMLNRLGLEYAARDMGPALGITGAQFRFAGILFDLGYLAAGLPAAWFLLRFGAPRWIGGIVLAWGAIALAHALLWDARSLYAMHLLLGAAEAGLVPAMVFYLAAWMPERHRSKAIAALIAATTLVPLLGGPGSDLILLLGRWFGLPDWRFLFVIEGLPTLWIGLHVAWVLPRTPADASWLPASERHWLLDQLRRNVPSPAVATRFADGLRDAPTRKLAIMHGVIGLVGGSLGLWVPLAMQRAGYVPPVIGTVIMVVAAVIGTAGTVAAGLLLDRRAQWCRALAAGFVLAGICLATAAVLPYGIAAVLALAIVACIAPAILALTWVLAPCLLAGAAAASGFALLGITGMLGTLGAVGLAVVWHDATARCMILAVACLAAAWLARKLEGSRPVGLSASAASPGE